MDGCATKLHKDPDRQGKARIPHFREISRSRLWVESIYYVGVWKGGRCEDTDSSGCFGHLSVGANSHLPPATARCNFLKFCYILYIPKNQV